MASRHLVITLMLAAVSYAARLRGVSVSDLLLDIYHTNMIPKCQYYHVASLSPLSVKASDNEQLVLIYNMTTPTPLKAAHLVIQVDPLKIDPVCYKPFTVSFNGSEPITLQMRLVNTSLIAAVDPAKLTGMVEVGIDGDYLTGCKVLTDEIFVLTNIDESCPAWKDVMLSGDKGRSIRSVDAGEVDTLFDGSHPDWMSEIDLAKHRSRRSGGRARNARSPCCRRRRFNVDFTLRNGSNSDYILHPRIVDVGQCEGNCTSPQCKNINEDVICLAKRSIVDEEYESELPDVPMCTPTKFETLPVLVVNTELDAVELRWFEDGLIRECRCE